MGIVVSVNVGQPREVTWQGRTVRSGIWKSPVEGRVFAGRLNLAGDGQADLNGHGGEQRALMVYQMASYRHWAAHFGRDDLVHGNFGENLTIEGLPDDEVCIGDRFRIGGAIFEISQPRVTCFKVGMRLGEPELPALLVAHGRPGFYFRVIQEGEIGAGDLIEKVADGPERMTVAEMDALLYSSRHPIASLKRAVRIPALSPGWQRSMHSLLDASEAGNASGNAGLSPIPAPALAWQGFRPVRIASVVQESTEVRSFELEAEDRSQLPPYIAGQHVVVRIRPDSARPAVSRNYSLCGKPEAATYRIAVKDEKGVASGFMHRSVQAGDVLEISAPRGDFTLAASPSPLVLLSAGIGITPILAMLYAAANIDAPVRNVWWVHSARDGSHHSFASETRELVLSLPKGHGLIAYSQPSRADELGTHYDVVGRITATGLKAAGVPQEADFYLCGPAPFIAAMQDGLQTWGVRKSKIFAEAFGPAALPRGVSTPPHLPDGEPGAGPTVTFARSGISVPWNPRFASLLELAEACAVPVSWSCRSGVCHNCESGLIDGNLSYSPQPLDPPAEGNALICCATPTSAVEIDL
jgi:ferredoxin-NADP reductase/MOSC domain-containing protein YiiM